MLLWLTQWLAHDIRAFNVFGYITLRAVLATLTALVLGGYLWAMYRLERKRTAASRLAENGGDGAMHLESPA